MSSWALWHLLEKHLSMLVLLLVRRYAVYAKAAFGGSVSGKLDVNRYRSARKSTLSVELLVWTLLIQVALSLSRSYNII